MISEAGPGFGAQVQTTGEIAQSENQPLQGEALFIITALADAFELQNRMDEVLVQGRYTLRYEADTKRVIARQVADKMTNRVVTEISPPDPLECDVTDLLQIGSKLQRVNPEFGGRTFTVTRPPKPNGRVFGSVELSLEPEGGRVLTTITLGQIGQPITEDNPKGWVLVVPSPA